MKTLLAYCLALYLVTLSEGGSSCNYIYEECAVEADCTSYIDLDINTFNRMLRCRMYIDRGGEIKLIYKDDMTNEIIPISSYQYDDFPYVYIVSLDLSDNNYPSFPNIYQLNNLKTLNVSHNNIIVAKLSNKENLESLTEIDFSYNRVTDIEINENENPFGKLIKLFLSHNNLQKIPKGVFSKFQDLEYLDLSYNHLNNISLFTFDGIQKLTYLKLSHNNINDINFSLYLFSNLKELYLNNNNIKSILAHDFETIYELKTLDLSYNSILTIEGEVFKNAVLLENVDLSNNMLVNIDKNIFTNVILLENVDLSNNMLVNIDKNIFSANPKLVNVNLSNNKLTQLPSDIFKGKNVSLFSISNNYLEGTLKRGFFEGLKLESILDLSNQVFTSIEDLAFFGLDKLTSLLLNNNIIDSISHKSFKTLRSLIFLDLSFNRITAIDFDKEDLLNLQTLFLRENFIKQISNTYFKHLNSLQFLDISQNNITHIEPESFLQLTTINNFIVSKNPLSGEIEASTFRGLNSVPALDLSCTFLSVVQNGSLDGMTDLNQLNISHSKLSNIQFNAFLNTGNIKIIDLSYNELRDFVINTTELINVKILLLNNNLIIRLSSDFVKGMINLSKLLLAHNSISVLNNDTFKDQRNLRYLDLSYNLNLNIDYTLIKEAKNLDTLILSNITSNLSFKDYREVALTKLKIVHSNIINLKDMKLNVLNKLQDLCLPFNNVNQLTVGTFTNLTELRYIDVSYNKISVIQPGVFKSNLMLMELNISHNALTELGYGVFRGLPNLKILDASFNLINSLESEQLYEVESLSQLIIDYNKISNLPLEDFSGTNLAILSIGDNPLPCKILSNLIKRTNPELVVTALRHVDLHERNSYGITCDIEPLDKSRTGIIPFKGNSTDDLLIDIRNILSHLSSNRVPNENDVLLGRLEKLQEENLKQMSQLGNFVSELQEEAKTSNNLLERILKVTVAMNSINRSLSVPIKDNLTSASIFDYLNKVRQDFANEMTIEKERILDEVEKKLYVLKKQIDSAALTTTAPVKNDLSLPKGSESSIFVKTCVGLTLFIVVCLVLIRIYKSRLYIPRNRSMSTRQIPDAMETSTI